MHIDAYDFGEIVIDGKTYNHDVIIYKNKVDDTWRRIEGHRLSLSDVVQIIEKQPQTLIIGTGADGVMNVPKEVRSQIEQKGISVIIMKTGEACEEYNQISKTSNVIAALHLTC